jgi:hypothetical protein
MSMMSNSSMMHIYNSRVMMSNMMVIFYNHSVMMLLLVMHIHICVVSSMVHIYKRVMLLLPSNNHSIMWLFVHIHYYNLLWLVQYILNHCHYWMNHWLNNGLLIVLLLLLNNHCIWLLVVWLLVVWLLLLVILLLLSFNDYCLVLTLDHYFFVNIYFNNVSGFKHYLGWELIMMEEIKLYEMRIIDEIPMCGLHGCG